MPLTPDEIARLVLEESRANQPRKTRSTTVSEEDDMDTPRKGLRVDWTINPSHMLTMGTLIFGFFAFGATMDKRVNSLEENRVVQRERDSSQDAAIKESRQEVREALVDLRRSIDKVGDRVGVPR